MSLYVETMPDSSQLSDDEEIDGHFDDLDRLYRQICREQGLPWPPLWLDEE